MAPPHNKKRSVPVHLKESIPQPPDTTSGLSQPLLTSPTQPDVEPLVSSSSSVASSSTSIGPSSLSGRDVVSIRRAHREGDVEASKRLHKSGRRSVHPDDTNSESELTNIGERCTADREGEEVSEYSSHPNVNNDEVSQYNNKLQEVHISGGTDGGGHPSHRGHTEAHGWTQSEYLKASVFGGLDGIVTIFAVVAGCVGANLTPAQLIVVGVGNLLADATSMGFGEYVSSKAESDFTKTEKQREIWEVENLPEEEQQEMVDIYVNRHHFSLADAKAMVKISFKYPKFFISHMMAEELGLLDQEDDGTSALKRGLVMFSSFAICGLVPLVAFLTYQMSTASALGGHGGDTLKGMEESGLNAFIVASVASMLTLFTLGVTKAQFVGGSPFVSGLMMVLNGTVAGSLAFGVGVGLQLYITS